MKKSIFFIATILLLSFILSCTPDKIELDSPKKVDIEKKLRDSGNQGLETDWKILSKLSPFLQIKLTINS